MGAAMRSLLRPRLQPGLLRRGLCAASRPTTHFGYRTVDEADKERLVGNVFDSVASNYDVMNDLMSAGIHRAWKDSFVRMLGVSAQSSANLQMLDIAGGTGDIAFRIADELAAHPASSRSGEPDERARLVVSDINKQMLDEGQRRAEKLSPSRTAGWPKLEWVVADAMRLPFDAELTRTPRGLRWVRAGYAYQPPALCTYRRRRAASPQGPTYSTYWVRVPASGVGYVPRTVAPQVPAPPGRPLRAHGGQGPRAVRHGRAGRRHRARPQHRAAARVMR